jgi:hypothetical protein
VVGVLLLWGDGARWVSAIRSENANTPAGQPLKFPPFPGGLKLAPLFFVAGYAVSIAALIALVIFTYAAATHARDLGIPARLTPVWAIIGWIVPVVSIWFPYWALRDCMPHGEVRGRDLALRWWLLYAFSSILIIFAVVARALSPVAGGVFLIGAVAYAAFEGCSGTQMLDRICRTHEAATANFVQPTETASANQTR